ncbi:spermidine synthase, partial [Fischerella thermalis CCMEE 5319]
FQATRHVIMTLPRGRFSPTIQPTIKELEQTLLVNT